MQSVMIVGRLGDDPDKRETSSGQAVCNFSVAVNEGRDITEWFRVVAWGKSAEFVGEYLKKGALVSIVGKIKTRSWEKDGIKRYQVELHTNHVESLSKAREEQPQEDRKLF